MKDIDHQHFINTVRGILNESDSTSIDKKFENELQDLYFMADHISAYKTWSTSNHIFSYLPQKAMNDKQKIDAFIESQLKYIEETMQLCKFQYNWMSTYFSLLGISFAMRMFLMDKEMLMNLLHDLHKKFWTDIKSYDSPFEMIKNAFKNVLDISQLMKEMQWDTSESFTMEFAKGFLNTRSFFDAFNITEKRIKTSFAIQVYTCIKSLSLSKYKTKKITDTIMHHLDIDAVVNLKKIDTVHCIGQIGFCPLYSYEPPIIPVKLLNQQSIYTFHSQKINEALACSNQALAEKWMQIRSHMGIAFKL